jgi:hypothetical protein
MGLPEKADLRAPATFMAGATRAADIVKDAMVLATTLGRGVRGWVREYRAWATPIALEGKTRGRAFVKGDFPGHPVSIGPVDSAYASSHQNVKNASIFDESATKVEKCNRGSTNEPHFVARALSCLLRRTLPRLRYSWGERVRRCDRRWRPDEKSARYRRTRDAMGGKRCSHGKEKYRCVQCSPCPHSKVKNDCAECNPCPHGKLKRDCAECNPCPHGKLKRDCAECNPCPHGKVKSDCAVCNPCPHGKLKDKCAECNPCPHGKVKSICAECNPCPHGKVKLKCAECNPCPHGKLKRMCAECNPCPHGKLKRNCAECNPCPHGKLKRNCAECRRVSSNR